MSHVSAVGSSEKLTIISLRGLSHEVCVAATQSSYWQKLTKESSISITSDGVYVPIELESMCTDDEERRLHLQIRSYNEYDRKQLDIISTRIHYDLIAFEKNDRPVYDPENQQMIVFGSVFNSLPFNIFDTHRILLGQRNCNIKRIKNTLGCSIVIDDTIPNRFRFTIRHQQQMVMDLAVIQIQALVKQSQYNYLMSFALKIGQRLVGPIECMEITENKPLLESSEFPGFTSFQPNMKRKREHEDEHISSISSPSEQTAIDSDLSDEDDSLPDEKRQLRREQVELLLTRICERMKARTPRDPKASAREDSSQIKSYFRITNASKPAPINSDLTIELVEHEMDLRTRGINEHKCTLVFNKLLKIGPGSRDRIKKTAKVLAYENLKKLTRDTPREMLTIKQTRDGLWKAIVKSTIQ